MTDALGQRMKAQYEDRTRFMLPRRTHTIIRVDGKAFHTYTRGLEKPFDYGLMDEMDAAATVLCKEAMGCKCAYGQSDEYSFLLTDFDTITTEAWFDGNVQKIASVAASIFTAAFAEELSGAMETSRVYSPAFDARVFTIPDPVEVQNYFIWRQQDATRNAIQMAGCSQFSPKQLHGVSTSQIQEKLFQEKGVNFNDYSVRAKRGRVIFKEEFTFETAIRTRWSVDDEMPILTQDRDYFQRVMNIPDLPRVYAGEEVSVNA